jgi:hypothetical protein
MTEKGVPMATTAEQTNPAAEVLTQLEERGMARQEPKAVARGASVQAGQRPEVQAVSMMAIDDGHGGSDVGALFGALAKAQGEFGPIERTLTAKIQSRREGGANYTFDYAPLDAVLAAVRPALSKNGIAVMQFPVTRGNTVTVRTLIGHESGQRMWNDLAVGCSSTDPKDIASAITYARRYALQALLGIAPDHDDDGQRASGDRGESGPRQSLRPDGETITSCRPMTRGDRTFYQVQTKRGTFYTEDKALYDVAEKAMRQERPVEIQAEQRAGADGKKYMALVEIGAS